MSSSIIDVKVDMDDSELENFNHKFADTLVFDEIQAKWSRCSMIDPAERNSLYIGVADRNYRFHNRGIDLRVNEVRLSKRSPDRGFYNNFDNGECLYLSRLPVRSYKHTITHTTSTFNNRAWELFPVQLAREITQTQGFGFGTRTSLGQLSYVLNNHRFVPFEEAIFKVVEGDMISCAFHKNFMLSLGLFRDSPEALQLWYDSVPIGMVNPSTHQINITKLLLLQEIKDTLKEQNCSWQVVE